MNTLINGMRLLFFPENSTDFVFQKVPEAIQSKIVYFYSVINELRSRDVHSMRNKILRSCLMIACVAGFRKGRGRELGLKLPFPSLSNACLTG